MCRMCPGDESQCWLWFRMSGVLYHRVIPVILIPGTFYLSSRKAVLIDTTKVAATSEKVPTTLIRLRHGFNATECKIHIKVGLQSCTENLATLEASVN